MTALVRTGDAVPWALAIAIPRISDRPDALFDEMLDFARAQPLQHLSIHYRSLLDWLTRRCGKQLWIEKSVAFVASLENEANALCRTPFGATLVKVIARAYVASANASRRRRRRSPEPRPSRG